MAHDISLFSGYSQKENRTTNYCLLVLRMLYEENPKLLDEALDVLTDGRTAGHVGVRFRQQQRVGASVPDGVIVQAPFALYVETKNFDWFYDAQLENHLAGLDAEPGLKVLLALSNFETTDGRFARIEALCRDQYEDRIAFAAVTFEDLLAGRRAPRPVQEPRRTPCATSGPTSTARACCLPGSACSTCATAPATSPTCWSTASTCARPRAAPTATHVRASSACTRQGGRPRRRDRGHRGRADRARDGRRPALVATSTTPAADLVQRARDLKAAVRPNADYPVRVFVLGPLAETRFVKDTSGGMMGSKQYFDVGRLGAEDASDLARKLDGMGWSDVLRPNG